MPDFIEVKFKGERKAWYANPLQYPFRVGDVVVVEAEKGEDFGRVNQVELPSRVTISPNGGLKKALRKA
ncbi:MAG: PSP1 domain-containing protein, partial [bacterium]